MKNNDQELEQIKRNPAVLGVYLSRVGLKKDGREYVGRCPFHSEKTPSFRISEHSGVWVWKCFGTAGACGSGNVFQFVQRLDGISFPESVRRVQELVGQSFSSTKFAEKTFRPVEVETKPAISYSLEEYSKFEKALEESKDARLWLENRGIRLDSARKLHLGYRADVGKLCGDENIRDKGWIAFPCIEGSRVVAIKYRSIVSKSFCKQGGMAKGESTPLFNTSDIEALEPIYLTEGEADAAILVQAGFRAASVQSSSTPCTGANKERLLEADYVILAGDNDPTGNEYMNKLWAEMQERTFKLQWPEPFKDANEVFLKKCGGDVESFRKLVEELTLKAKATPMPSVSSLQEIMLSSGGTSLAQHPRRLRFPWPKVDAMAIIPPGGIASVFATSTKQGKTTWVAQVTIHGARYHSEVVLNYSAELSPEEFSTLATSHVLKKDRNHLSKEDYQAAAKKLSGVRYYLGYDPTITKVDPALDLIEAAIRRLGATLVVLDHIHFICRNESDTIKAQENAMQRIKLMAVKYGVKFIVVGQPRKANQQNKGKLVDISDWKSSEAGTSDSHAIYAIHRDRIKDRDENTQDDYDPITSIHLLGCRSKGDGGTFAELIFFGKLSTFEEMTQEEPPPSNRFFEGTRAA